MNQTASSSSGQQMTFTLLQQFLSEHPVFGELSDMEMLELSGAMEIQALEAGETLFRQGDPGDSVYLVLAGSLDVRIQSAGVDGILVDKVFSGDLISEIAFVTGQPRMATITARERARLARLPNDVFTRLAEQHPQITEELSRQVLPRFRHTQLVNILRNLFGEINMRTFQEIEQRLSWKHLLPGEILFRQGEPADSLYIVISGRLRVVVKDFEGEERRIGELGHGDFTGEFGLITKEARSATVYAVHESEVVQLSQSLFEHLLAEHAPAMLQFTRLIVRRVARFNQSQTASQTTFSAITVVPVHPAISIDSFTDQLFAALSRDETVLKLSSRSFDDLYNRPGAAQTSIGDPNEALIRGWLTEKETQYSCILYQADQTFTEWTKRCLSQSDRILLVGEAGMSPSLGEIEQMSAGMNLMAHRELVLMQKQTQKLAGETKQWLAPRQVRSHYHIRPGNPQDFQRLVRRLAGKATGLVLGGGGARGIAHVGVLRALEEAGVEIDLIGGTSIGALFGAGYACGYSTTDMLKYLKIFSRPSKVLDFTLPFTSLTASRKVTELLHQIYSETQIEDLNLPFFCVSSNLTRAEPMVHRTGPLWEGVRASLAIPGIFSPVPFGTDLLVDGGVLNNLPVDVMRELCERGYVIGVNVAPKREAYQGYSFGPNISGWQILREKIFPFGKRQNAPSILYNLMRSMEVNGLHRLRFAKEQADLVIEPPVGKFGTLEFDRFEELIAIGYQASKDIKMMMKV